MEVFQNPKAGSSIGSTQHTHVTRASLADWPIFCLEQQSQEVGGRCTADGRRFAGGTTIDVVQVGAKDDAVVVRVCTTEPACAAVVHLLHAIRLDAYAAFGARCVDFVCLVYVDDRGDGGGNGSEPVEVAAEAESEGHPQHEDHTGFVIVFIPISTVEKRDGVAFNTATDEGHVDYSLPYRGLDGASCKGSLLCETAEATALACDGAAMLARLYDFAAMPGLRKVLAETLAREAGFVDGAVGAVADRPPVDLAVTEARDVKPPVFPIASAAGC